MKDETLYTQLMPPTIQDVKIYFGQRGMPEPEAETFFLLYEKKLWVNKKGAFYKNWKDMARRWIASVIHNNPWHFNGKPD